MVPFGPLRRPVGGAMLGPMTGTSAPTRLCQLVDDYARRVYPSVLAQHDGASVCSPLGVWLLLAACAPAGEGEERRALEEALGCPAEEAAELLHAFVRSPPPALRVAMALWVSAADATEALAQWARSLPSQIESGYMPTQAEADAWAKRNTLDLIGRFPLSIDGSTRIVLASALATKVSWIFPFDVAAAFASFGRSSPWSRAVDRVLLDRTPAELTAIVNTSAAGVVAVHSATAKEGLTVVSVSADPSIPRGAVLGAVHEVAADAGADAWSSRAQSLFDLSLGDGHSWSSGEREVATHVRGERLERITEVRLPAWRIESDLDLLESESFGSEPALAVMRKLIGPRPDDNVQAGQAAVASYTRYGFEAAAVTAFGIACSAQPPPQERGLERTAMLRFDHPYAVVAFAGDLAGQPDPTSPFHGVPLFSAWVAAPQEVETD